MMLERVEECYFYLQKDPGSYYTAQIRLLLLASSIHPKALQRMHISKNNPYLAHSVLQSV